MSHERLASIMSIRDWLVLTLDPSRLAGISRACGSEGRAPPPWTRNRPSSALAMLEPWGETSLSRSTCCGWLASPPAGTIQIAPSSAMRIESAGGMVIGPDSPSTGRPSPVVSTPVAATCRSPRLV